MICWGMCGEWCSDIYDETVYGKLSHFSVVEGGVIRKEVLWQQHVEESHPFSFKIDDLGFRIATSHKK